MTTTVDDLDLDFSMTAPIASAPKLEPPNAGRIASFKAYKAIDAVNWSSLKQLYVGKRGPLEEGLCITSPHRYRYFQQHGDDRDTAAMRLGRAVHTAVFEPHRLAVEYIVCTCSDKRAKAHQLCKRMAKSTGRTLLGESEHDKAQAIRDAVRSSPLAMAYLEQGEPEKTIRWTHGPTGLHCKSRLDWLAGRFPCVVDLKTTNDISERTFKSLAERMGYFRQLAMYTAGAVACDLIVAPKAVIIAVENRAPYEVAVYPIEPDSLKSATDEVDELLATLKRCRETDTWPPRYTTEQVLARPDWVTGEPEIAFEE